MNDNTAPPPPLPAPPLEQMRQLALIDDLRALPAETAWAEFKENNTDPELIGKLISALSNAARLADQHFAYVLWGIRDGDHAVVGTAFDPSAAKHKNQSLDFWLSQCLQPAIAFCFKSIDYAGHRLVLLEIPAAATSPVEFDKTAFVRIGSATPRLSDHPERQKLLWTKIQPYAWETGIAAQFLTGDEVLARLDYTSYFELTGQPLPDNRACYQHASLKYVSGDRMTNATLRERFGIAERNASQASGVIRLALDGGLIRAADPEHPRAGYVPYWA